MLTTWRLVATLLVISVSVHQPERANAEAVDPDKVDAAVRRNVAWFYERQNANGGWERSERRDSESVNDFTGLQWGGRTALVTYALLTAGESPQDPRIQKAVTFLKEAELIGTYAISIRLLVWMQLPQTEEVKTLTKRDASLLLGWILTEGRGAGHYGYTNVGPKGNYSHSRSQYGLLGMWAAAEMGLEVPARYWQLAETGWLRNQDKDGGWRYKHTDDPGSHDTTPGMTAAGVASLFITQEFLHANEGINCRGNVTSPPLEAGLKWLADNFDKVGTDKRYPRDWPYPTLYAVDRVGVASGYKYFNGIDWYAHGANWLIEKQRANGSWSATGGGGSGDNVLDDINDSAFALLFLTGGRAPVGMNKLQYAVQGRRGEVQAGPWNQRPRDVANLVRWAGKQAERKLNWQIVNLDVEDAVRDMHDAPVLFISGDADLKFTDEQVARLRQYVLEGGLILGNPDCNRRNFTRAMQDLGERMFPEYRFRPLEGDSALFTAQQFPAAQWRRPPTVLAMSNGVRELILIPNQDLAKDWQLNDTRNTEGFEFAANVMQYVVSKDGFWTKGRTHITVKDPAVRTAGKLTVARLSYDGNWNPEPFGWQQMAAVMHNDRRVQLDVVEVPITDLVPAMAKVAHLTGTSAVKLSEAQRQALKTYVEGGGLLVVDAAGGASAFATSMQQHLGEIFGNDAATALTRPLEPGHALYAAGGEAVGDVRYRLWTRRQVTGALQVPRLRGIEIDGWLAVVLSAEDLSNGLVGREVDGVVGYTPQTASRLMQCILLYGEE
ncbi:MAG: DUF4159 domain-containing protein [Phycisphaerae bacterium]